MSLADIVETSQAIGQNISNGLAHLIEPMFYIYLNNSVSPEAKANYRENLAIFLAASIAAGFSMGNNKVNVFGYEISGIEIMELGVISYLASHYILGYFLRRNSLSANPN